MDEGGHGSFLRRGDSSVSLSGDGSDLRKTFDRWRRNIGMLPPEAQPQGGCTSRDWMITVRALSEKQHEYYRCPPPPHLDRNSVLPACISTQGGFDPIKRQRGAGLAPLPFRSFQAHSGTVRSRILALSLSIWGGPRGVVGVANMVSPGSFQLKSWRTCTAHPACQLENSRSTRVRQIQ